MIFVVYDVCLNFKKTFKSVGFLSFAPAISYFFTRAFTFFFFIPIV